MEAETRYDCIECGHTNCVTVVQNTGFCNTDGCVVNHLIQFVYYPDWKKPKTSRAGREIWWNPHEQPTLPRTNLIPKKPLMNKPVLDDRTMFKPK